MLGSLGPRRGDLAPSIPRATPALTAPDAGDARVSWDATKEAVHAMGIDDDEKVER